MFLYSTVSTLKPIVGMVVTTSASFSLYSRVVLPAASRPTAPTQTQTVNWDLAWESEGDWFESPAWTPVWSVDRYRTPNPYLIKNY